MRYLVAGLLTIQLFISVSCSSVREAELHPDQGLKPVVLIGSIAFYPQKEKQCGPASLAAVLNFWGVGSSPDEIAGEIFSGSARGTLNLDMVLYPRSKGLESKAYSGTLTDLRDKIGAGLPMIVMVDYGSALFQVNHFMVITGYAEGGLIVNSGEKKGLYIPDDEFLRIWEKTGYWTLLVKKTEGKEK